MKTIYLNKDYKNLEELKNHYRKLMLQYHPDINIEGEEITKIINNEYEMLFPTIKVSTNAQTEEKATDFIDLLKNIIHLDITIEIIGTWVWVSGNTFPHKEILKENGFKWASKKKVWYLNPTGTRKKTKKQFTQNELKNMFGYETVKKQTKTKALK